MVDRQPAVKAAVAPTPRMTIKPMKRLYAPFVGISHGKAKVLNAALDNICIYRYNSFGVLKSYTKFMFSDHLHQKVPLEEDSLSSRHLQYRGRPSAQQGLL